MCWKWPNVAHREGRVEQLTYALVDDAETLQLHNCSGFGNFVDLLIKEISAAEEGLK